MKKLVLLFCTAILMSGCSGKPTDAYKAYIECIEKGKPAEAFSKLDKTTQKMDLKDKDSSATAAKEILQFIDGHKGLKQMDFNNVVTKGDAASAKVKLLFNDKFVTELDTKYIKEDGVWKLSFAP